MPVLIDAYNLLHSALGEAGGGRDLGLHGLARVLQQGRYAGQQVTLVCDGHRAAIGERIDHHIRVVFAGSGRDADSVLEHMIARDSAPGRLLVVSSDRRVQVAARRRRCMVMSSEAFLGQVLRDSAASPKPLPPTPRDRVPLGAAEVAHWMAAFGERATRDSEIVAAEQAARAPARGSTSSGRKLAPENAAPRPPAPTGPPVAPKASASPKPPEAHEALRADPLLAEAIETFDGITWDDLDMARWLGERGAGGDGGKGSAGSAGQRGRRQ